MISVDNAAMLLDQGEVIGSDGDTIGKVGQVYVDNQAGALSWVTVKTGWFGMSESFVPLDRATCQGNIITVPYDKEQVKKAPKREPGAELSIPDEQELYSYYGVQQAPVEVDLPSAVVEGTDSEVAYTQTPVDYNDVVPAGPADSPIDSHDPSITRSEEQLRVGTESVESGRARLRKYVVTEQETVAVPVSHDEVHIVREPIEPGNATDPTIGEDSIEVTLMQDEVVVSKDAVAVEKVRLDTETLTDSEQVTQSVRKEQIEVDHNIDVGTAADAAGIQTHTNAGGLEAATDERSTPHQGQYTDKDLQDRKPA